MDRKNRFEYFIQEVTGATNTNTKTLTIERELKKVVEFVKKVGLKSKKDMADYNQWFPYVRVVAYKPSGKIKILNLQN